MINGNQQLLQEVADEIKGLITEEITHYHWTLIKLYHRVGNLILTLPDPYSAVHDLARLTEKSERTLYLSLQFVKKYPDINALPEGKVITWNKIVTKYLPEPKEEEPCEHEPITICKKCRLQII